MSTSIRGQDTHPPRILIAGGGVAAVEALLALRSLVGARIELVLLAPEPSFRYRPLAVVEALGGLPAPTLDLFAIARDVGAHVVHDSLVAVNGDENVVITGTGGRLRYDALILALGARATEAVPGAITFAGDAAIAGVRRLIAEAEELEINRLAFAMPAGPGWPLPLYELSIMAARRLRDARRGRVLLVTPEQTPLSAFGGRASGTVLEALEDLRVELYLGSCPERFESGILTADPGGEIPADAVVALPALSGPRLPGVPHDARGFVPVDRHGRVPGLGNVYAAGDMTAYPVKQGGLAAQQADAAAEDIAARLGVPIDPAPYRPVLRGMLLTGENPRFVESDGTGTGSAIVDDRPLWAPVAKIAGKYLAPFLAARLPDVELERREAGSGVLLELSEMTGERFTAGAGGPLGRHG